MSLSLSRFQAILLCLVVFLILGLGGYGLFAVGSRQWYGQDALHLSAGLRDLRGIEIGTRVRVQGVDAGEVEAIELPAEPGGLVQVRMRLQARFRPLVREDATVQILNEGILGGKAMEIQPGTPGAAPVQDGAQLAARSSVELSDVLAQVQNTLEGIREGQGVIGKLLKDDEMYQRSLEFIQRGHETLDSFQQDADALKRMPIVRSYVEDTQAILVRPNCNRERQIYPESDLFEPGRAILTPVGRVRLDVLGPWLALYKRKNSEVVVVSYLDPKQGNSAASRILTKQRSEAVCNYLKKQHSVQKMGWVSTRKVIPIGLGTSPPPLAEPESLPPARTEVLVFMPQE